MVIEELVRLTGMRGSFCCASSSLCSNYLLSLPFPQGWESQPVNLGDTHIHTVAVGSGKVAHDVGLRALEGWGEVSMMGDYVREDGAKPMKSTVYTYKLC